MVPIWIFTQNGFFTFVTDRKDPSYLWLRARMREHLEDNFPGVKAEEHPGADYLYRAKVKRVDVAERIAEMVMDSRIDSHFKDVMIRTAAKPKTGNLANVMYAVWRGAAEWQPYAPYSRIPRSQERKNTYWTPPAPPAKGKGKGKGGTTVTTGTYARGADYDWAKNPWSRQGTPVGEPARDQLPDPKPLLIKTAMGDLTYDDVMTLPETEFEAVWAAMTPTEQAAFLDREEADLRWIELAEESGDDAGDLRLFEDRWFPSPGTAIVPAGRDWGQVETDRRAADRERQAKVRGRKGRKGRKNRHSQQG